MKNALLPFLFLLVLGPLSGAADAGDIVINEVMSQNSSAWPDESGEFDDWIEIMNTDETSRDVAGFALTKGPGVPEVYVFPSLVLAPGERAIVWADESPEQGAAHAPFHLDAEHDFVQLLDDTGAVIDSLSFRSPGPNRSRGRWPDGTGSFRPIASPSPGAANVVDTPTGAVLFVNELMADNVETVEDPDSPGAHPDWFEIFNPGPAAVDLGGMFVTDSLVTPMKYRIPEGTTVPAAGHRVFWADDDDEQGALHTNFKLSKSGDELGLFDRDGLRKIDSVKFSAQKPDRAYARNGDGARKWHTAPRPTPGAANPTVDYSAFSIRSASVKVNVKKPERDGAKIVVTLPPVSFDPAANGLTVRLLGRTFPLPPESFVARRNKYVGKGDAGLARVLFSRRSGKLTLVFRKTDLGGVKESPYLTLSIESGPYTFTRAVAARLRKGGLRMKYKADGGGGVDGVLLEDRTVYDQDSLEIVDLAVTVLPGGATIEEVDADTDGSDEDVPEAVVSIAEPGYAFPDGASTETGRLRIRGQTSRLSAQKSYRIELDSRTNLWRNHRILQLNKHPWDLTRMRQKLTLDLFESLDHMTSLRTRFVRLSVNGVDYGIYTLVERCNEQFLAVHGLDENGHLYKANFFEFERYPDHLRNTDDPEYDVDRFEEILEIRGEANDHSKLLEMLDAVNDFGNDINDVVAKYFQRDNYLTWLATNILLENIDTNSQNFFLYSPTDSDRWYFLPWDCDGTWGFYGQPIESTGTPLPRWQKGISNWWGVILHRRFLMDPGNLADLIAKVEELETGFFTPSRVNALLDSYRARIVPDLVSSPDFEWLSTLATEPADRVAELNGEIDRLSETPDSQRRVLMDTLERPMPVYLGDPEVHDGRTWFRWDESFDLQGDGITYDVSIATDPRFRPEDIVREETGLTSTSLDIESLPAGTWYFRVVVRDTKDPANHWQYPFDCVYVGETRFEGQKRY